MSRVAVLCAGCLVLMMSRIDIDGAQAETYQFQRRYVDGDSYRYRVTSKAERNGMPDGEATAVSHHTVVVPRDGAPFERIGWIQYVTRDASGRETPSADAEKVPPYEISLAAQGRVDLPRTTVPAMIGMVTDLNTFMVAISPRVGVQRLRTVGDRHTHPELLRGNFADGRQIVLGQDCTELTLTLRELTADMARIETRFVVPTRECLGVRTWMTRREPLASNFQMIRNPSGEIFDAFWGTEVFTVVSEVRRSNGQILKATMDNTLDLTMKTCDVSFAICKGEYPVKSHRVVTLDLLP